MTNWLAEFKCPNCNALLAGRGSHCDECQWPNHERIPGPPAEDQRVEETSNRRFQFRLRSLLIVITAVCVTSACIHYYGVDGVVARITFVFMIASLFSPLLDFYLWWKRNDLDKF